MFTRTRTMIGLALIATLLIPFTAFAKGGFDFITITGPDLKGVVRVTDSRLTADFFTFANFYEDKTRAPTDPGVGYEITRHYEQGMSNVIFDRLHYYPETGFVFYDGIENGDSEYDGEWYKADPEIRPVFESVLPVSAKSAALSEKKQPAGAPARSEPEESTAKAMPVASNFPALPVLMTVLAAGLAGLLAIAIRRRRPSTQ